MKNRSIILWQGEGWYAQRPGKMQWWQPEGVWFKVALPHVAREKALEVVAIQGTNPDTLTKFEQAPEGFDVRGPRSESLAK